MAISLRFSKKKRKRKSQVSTAWLLPNKGRSSTRDLSESQISALLHSQKRSMQWRYSDTKTFSLGFEHIEGNVQKLFYFISLHVAWLFYSTFN
jgi:hypothetical protein